MRIDGNFSYPPWLFHGGILILIICYEDYEENAILAELKGGYTYKDRVLRPTLVKVNKKEEVKNNE